MPVLLWFFVMVLTCPPVMAKELTPLMLGLELGELPVEGSFKLGVNFGYGFSRQHELFISYQIPDQVTRNSDSFNAHSTGLEGLSSSTEVVSKRAQILGIWRGDITPFYLSYGFVYNGQDREQMKFKAMPRQLNYQQLQGPLLITVTRPAGYSPALGLGLSWLIKGGYQLFIQWSGNVFQKAVAPQVQIQSDEINTASRQQLESRIKNRFRKKITNVYHVFSLGIRF
mgnify:CR=1 FL=1